MTWIALSHDYLGSSSGWNSVMSSLQGEGLSCVCFRNFCQCDYCPMCYCGQEDYIAILSERLPETWKVCSGLTYATSSAIQHYIDLCQTVVAMDAILLCDFYIPGTTQISDCLSMFASSM